MESSFEQIKAKFLEELERSRLFELIEEAKKTTLRKAIAAADQDRFSAARAKFYEDEKKLREMDREIEEAERKKRELVAKKKAFLADLEKKIAQDKVESEKAASEILEKLDNI